MCCIHGICIFAPGANVSANMIFHPVYVYYHHGPILALLRLMDEGFEAKLMHFYATR